MWVSSTEQQLLDHRIEKEENENVERWSKRFTLLGDFCKVPPSHVQRRRT
jgi:hypothetical protein